MREHGASLSLSHREKEKREEEREERKRKKKKKGFFSKKRNQEMSANSTRRKESFILTKHSAIFFLQLSLATSSSLFFLFFFFFFLSPVQPLMFCSHPLSFLFSLWIFSKNTGSEKRMMWNIIAIFFSIAGDMILDRFRVTEHIKKKEERKKVRKK